MKKTFTHSNIDLFEKRFVYVGGAPSEGGANPPEATPQTPEEGEPSPLNSPQARAKFYQEAEARAAAMEESDPEMARQIRANVDAARESEAQEGGNPESIAHTLQRVLMRLAAPKAKPAGQPTAAGAALDKMEADVVAQLEGKPTAQSKRDAEISEELDTAAAEQIAKFQGDEAQPGTAEANAELAKAEQAADKTAAKLAEEGPPTGVPKAAPIPDMGPAQGEVQEKKPDVYTPVRIAKASNTPAATPTETVSGSGKAAPVKGPRVEEVPRVVERTPSYPDDVQTAANNFAKNPDKYPGRVEGSDGNIYTFQVETSTSQGIQFRRPKITLEGKKGA